MGRKRTGYKRPLADGRVEAWVGKDYLGIYDDAKADRMIAAFIARDAGKAPESFAMFAEPWMTRREIAARRRKRARSFAKERSRWNTHVVTAPFYTWHWKRISPQVVQEWVNSLFEKHATQTVRKGKSGTIQKPTGRRLSRRVVEDSLSLVKLCLDAAVVAGKFAYCHGQNPARVVIMPSTEAPEEVDGELIVHLTVEEIEALFALDLPPFQRAVFAIAIYAGLRLGEIWGLRWQDVILTGPKPELRVRRSYDGPVKTRSSVRNVPLKHSPRAIEAIQAWKDAQPTTPIAGLVFPGDDGSCHGESFTAGWRDKVDNTRDEPLLGWRSKAGIRPEVTFHALRHTCGCHLAQGTWTPQQLTLHTIKRWLGHGSIAVTERHYATLTSDNLHNAIDEGAFTGYLPGAVDDHTR